MSKKRPRTAAPSRRDPVYWRRRLFKNAFIYKGKRVQVPSWSVKIQLFGKRKSFTLNFQDRAQAAGEACQIYQTIIERGWEAVIDSRPGAAREGRAVAGSLLSPASIPFDAKYWKRRLTHRKYPGTHEREFAVRVEHARLSHYFPLGTVDETEAAARAMTIYQTIVRKGWAIANAQFARELSLALRWQDNPLAWTYTTIHTRLNPMPPRPLNGAARRSEHSVVFIEPDAGIRNALAECANSQPGFRCERSFADVSTALRELPHVRVDLLLANHDLPEAAGAGSLEKLLHVRPELFVLSYSVFEDADQLFKSTPGGSVVYMLNRTLPRRIFEPIEDLTEKLTREQIASCVRKYFQQLAALLPSGPPFWKLAKLTPREHEILEFLSKGELVKEVADRLGISTWTVQGHVKSIFEKLKVHTRTEAVIKYLHK